MLFTKILTLLLFIPLLNSYSQNIWEQTNGPNGTRIEDFAKNSFGHIFAVGPDKSVSHHGGVVRSTNNGEYWDHIGLANFYVKLIEIDQNDNIYAVTSMENGIFRSTNDGGEWIEIGPANISVNTLKIDSYGYIFIGTESSGIFTSTDNGNNWSEVNNGIPSGYEINCMAINSNNDIYVSLWKDINSYYDFRMYCSKNNGETWFDVTNDLINAKVNYIFINTNNQVLVGSVYGVYRYDENNENWVELNVGLSNRDVNFLINNSDGHLFAGTEGGIYYSTNNGTNWENTTNDLPTNSVYSLEINSSNEIFIGSDDGIFISSNNGGNWSSKNKGISNTDFRSLFVSSGNNIYGGVYEKGIYFSSNNGDNWIKRNNGLNDLVISSFIENSDGDLFAGSYGVYKSTNNGLEWVKSNMPEFRVSSLAMNSMGHIFAGGYKRVFCSTNNGDEWLEISNGMPNGNVQILAINSMDHIFAGTYENGVFRSTNNGLDWSEINTGILSPTLQIYSIAINKSDELFIGLMYKLYFSSDNGNTWQYRNLTSIALSSIVIDSSANIYVSTIGRGVFMSSDNGETWNDFDSGLIYDDVNRLAISESHLFASVNYGGVFRKLNSTTSVYETQNDIPASFDLSQNYPNPFNPVTKIKYSIPANVETSYMTSLRVFDILGNEVAELVNEQKQAGTYEVKFNAGDLSSGVYFYRLQTSSGIIMTKKLLLLK